MEPSYIGFTRWASSQSLSHNVTRTSPDESTITCVESIVPLAFKPSCVVSKEVGAPASSLGGATLTRGLCTRAFGSSLTGRPYAFLLAGVPRGPLGRDNARRSARTSAAFGPDSPVSQ